MRELLAAGVALCVASAAQAQMRITEYMYQGTALGAQDAEFIEFTNVGGAAIDMTGWSFDDSSRTPGSVDLSDFGLVMPGESVLLCQPLEADFRTNWSLPASVKIIGSNSNNLGRNDEINLYNAFDALVDRLTYGDQDFPGTFRTQLVSAWVPGGGLGANDPYQWQASDIGDAQGSYVALNGDLGNPGMYVPEPATMAMLALGGLALVRRRR